MPIQRKLRPYQMEIGRAVLGSVLNGKGLTFSVEIARQGGKNELSAQLELLLLAMHMLKGGNSVKAAPTRVPQSLISVWRLKERLREAGLEGVAKMEAGPAIRLGRARQLFLPAGPTAHVVGATAHILLEVDEAQEVSSEKYYKEFRPMGASTNVTTVLYGTPWEERSLLEEVKQSNLELERRDGIRRHFRFGWEEVAAYNPDYARFVEAERARLGEEHPLFRTQYRLLPLAGGGGLISPAQRAQLQGSHLRLSAPTSGQTYVAGLDLAGEGDSQPGDGVGSSQRDFSVLTIGELGLARWDPLAPEPVVRIVEHYRWRNTPHSALYPQLVDLLREVWRCRRVVVDSTGVGAGVASFLRKVLGSGVVLPYQFNAASKSELGYQLLSAVNTGRVKMYAMDGSDDAQEFWRQMEWARVSYRPNGTMGFLVEPRDGHDDYLISLALLVKASDYLPRTAKGRVAVPEAVVR